MKDTIGMAIVGLGGRGQGLLRLCISNMKDVKVVAVCDSYADRAEKGKEIVTKKGAPAPLVATDYKQVIGLPEVDCVLISAAWEAHTKIAVEAMRLGKFVGIEVGGAYTLDECRELVKAYEETGCHCMMLENCCYGKYELMCKNMADKGLFGEIVHCEGGYCHDLRTEIADGVENRHYRLNNYLNRNCENYPTHELGPICKLLHVNNGNRILSLSSFAGKSVGLEQFVREKRPKSDLVGKKFAQADIVKTFLKLENGETVVLTLDTTLPRAYSRQFTVRGTKGLYNEDNNMVYLDDVHTGKPFEFYSRPLWGNGRKYAKKYAHPICKKKVTGLARFGHGGMDWRVLRAMVETVKHGAYPPIDTYDTALWMSITPLSEISIKNGGAPVEVPDFTNGGYKTRKAGVLPNCDIN